MSDQTNSHLTLILGRAKRILQGYSTQNPGFNPDELGNAASMSYRKNSLAGWEGLITLRAAGHFGKNFEGNKR